jgi:5'-nucleotidase
MKKILITNDDGFDSEGLLALADALKDLGEVTIVAPTVNKSACGHSLTLDRPLNFVKLKEHFYKLDDGTPTDCIFLSLNKLFTKENRPDIVVSGINIGSNKSINYINCITGESTNIYFRCSTWGSTIL